MTKLKSLVMGLLMIVAVATGATEASAAGNTGGWVGPYVDCFSSIMVATPPAMDAVPLATRPGTLVLGPTHRQWVAHRHWLQRWANGRWVTEAAGSWWQTQVVDRGLNPALGYYINVDTGQHGNGSTFFTINGAGHYKVVTELYWYADPYVGWGDAVAEAFTHTDMRSLTPSSRRYCSYG